MSEELQKIVDEYREKEIHISDEEAEQILWLCNRKMDICKIENREEYLPLLFKDEVKNYLFRCSVNATTFFEKIGGRRNMCAECGMNPCHPRCPNAPEPVPIHECVKCGYGILAGDKFWDSPEGKICKECVDDMSAEEILKLCGESLTEAEKEER